MSSFQYVLIPAAESEPIATHEASKEGGLMNDALSKNAKQYFLEQSNKGGASEQRAKLLEVANPDQKKQIALKIRAQYQGSDELSKKIQAMTDDEIVDLLKLQESQQSSPSCEITCLTIPTPLNGHTAVSMYGDDHARTKNLPFNQRATNLMMACGHAFSESPGSSQTTDGKPNGIYGDVFVGRAIDNEAKDIWERVDMLPSEVEGDLQKQPWCKIARKKGGGGGRGGAAASLSNTLQNFQNQQLAGNASKNAAIANTAANTATTDDATTSKGYTWSQSEDEVEIRFVVPKETKTKNVKVKFGSKSLKVSLEGIECDKPILLEGETWDKIEVDGSTFTIQNEPNAQPTGRELCVSLEKQTPGQTWNYPIEEE